MESKIPEPRKVGVWAEGTHIEAREYIIPKKSPDSSDDIPTLPDLDDFPDILEKDVPSVVKSQNNIETVNTLAEVGSGITGSVEGVDSVLHVLKSYVPQVETDTADNVWTVDSLLTELADESEEITT